MQYLRSLIFTTVLFGSALVWAIPISLSVPFSRPRRFTLVRSWARFVMATAGFVCGLDYVVEGRENLPDKPAVIYLKHASAWEAISAIVECPPHTWVLKRELTWIPLIGSAVMALWCIAINRKAGMTAVDQVVQQGLTRLRGGFHIMIFPEGTRMAPGQTRRFGRSGALLAIRARCPVVPIAHNAGDYWARRSILKRPGTIRFCIGPPIETRGKTAAQVNAEAKDWIDRKMASISPAHDFPVARSSEVVDTATPESG